MVDISQLFSGVMGLSQIIRGGNVTAAGFQSQAQTHIQAGEIQAQGFGLQADAFRQQSVLVGQASEFDLGVQALNFQRRQKAVARQFSRISGQQQQAQASSGLALTSKSFLMVQNESRTIFEQGLLNLKIDNENQVKGQRFRTEIKQVQLENQARGAEHSAAVARVMAANQASAARFQGEVAQFKSGTSAASGATTLLSQLFN